MLPGFQKILFRRGVGPDPRVASFPDRGGWDFHFSQKMASAPWNNDPAP